MTRITRTDVYRVLDLPSSPKAGRSRRSSAGLQSRSAWRAWWRARRAVRAEIPLDEFLRASYRSYLPEAPLGHLELPTEPPLDGWGKIQEAWLKPRSHPVERLLPEVDSGGVPLESVSVARAEHWKEDLSGEQTTLAELRVAEVRARSELSTLRKQHREAASRATGWGLLGGLFGGGDRPRLPYGGRMVAWALFWALCLAAEAFQLALPILNTVGIDTTALAFEAQRAPVSVALGTAFALGATGVLFLLVHWLVELVRESFHRRERVGAGRRAVEISGMALLAVLTVAAAVGIGTMRSSFAASSVGLLANLQGQASSSSPAAAARWVFELLTLLLPLGVAYSILVHTERLRASRSKAAEELERWRRNRAERRSEEARLQKLVQLGHRALQRVRRRRIQCQERIAELQREVIEVEAAVRVHLESERRYQLAWGRAIVAALERDRHSYLAAQSRLQRRQQRGWGWRPVAWLRRTAAAWLCLVLLSVLACNPEADIRTPQHIALVCPASALGAGQRCDREARVRRFDGWLRRAIRLPGSTFVVWRVGESPGSRTPIFAACIPSSWGGSVLQTKSAFAQAGRRTLAGRLNSPAAIPHDCQAPDTRAVGRFEIEAPGSPLAVGESADRLPVHQAVLCDRSDSSRELSCTAPVLTDAFERWFGDGGSVAGSSLTVYTVGHGYDTVERQFVLTTPGSAPGERLAAALGGARQIAALPLPRTATENASAVVEAVHLAATELLQRSGERRLLILSDLRQVTPGRWNFERRVPTADEFLPWLGEQSLVADLSSIAVWVCGVHHKRSPGEIRHSAATAKRLEDIWRAVFDAMGASRVEIRADCGPR